MGMSTRAIATALGVSQSTASRDVRAKRRHEPGMTYWVDGLDGKTYPANHDAEERLEVFAAVHRLRHGGLTYRGIQQAFTDAGGRAPSLGTIKTYLTDWTCEQCRPVEERVLGVDAAAAMTIALMCEAATLEEAAEALEAGIVRLEKLGARSNVKREVVEAARARFAELGWRDPAQQA